MDYLPGKNQYMLDHLKTVENELPVPAITQIVTTGIRNPAQQVNKLLPELNTNVADGSADSGKDPRLLIGN